MSQEEIEYKSHSKKRIVIEHTICQMKKRIFAELFRNKLRNDNRISDIVSGLINYRIKNHYNKNIEKIYGIVWFASDYARDL